MEKPVNTQIINIINDFAKSNRIGKARVEELVSKVLENCKTQTKEKTVRTKSPSKRDMQFNFIKGEIEILAKNYEVFSVLGIARKFEVSPYIVHKAIMECKNENLIKQANIEKTPGSRGRQATLWMINS